jgi:hypothetical protein
MPIEDNMMMCTRDHPTVVTSKVLVECGLRWYNTRIPWRRRFQQEGQVERVVGTSIVHERWIA